MTRSGQRRGAFVTLDERAVYAHVLGQVIRRHRGQLPQANLALASGLSASALSRFELGQSQPDVYEIARRPWFPLELSSTKATVAPPAPKPTLTVREINAIVRAADGRNVYLIRRRLDEETIQRVTRARTKGREMEVRSLSTGNWLPVLPDLGDRLEVR